MIDVDTQRRINNLLQELRSWAPDEQRYTQHELADKFNLDLFMVSRIVQSEGMSVEYGYRTTDPPDEEVDPNAVTQEVDVKSLEEDSEVAVRKGTEIWKVKPTGKWPCVDDDD